ncbi:hypothetical protein K438DRAFT_1768769 [Mycena galopus ATCC 62051]|nr:hypothetical protein K438DRAFT_1768769 [Mycena galopus ATCC 62051]
MHNAKANVDYANPVNLCQTIALFLSTIPSSILFLAIDNSLPSNDQHLLLAVSCGSVLCFHASIKICTVMICLARYHFATELVATGIRSGHQGWLPQDCLFALRVVTPFHINFLYKFSLDLPLDPSAGFNDASRAIRSRGGSLSSGGTIAVLHLRNGAATLVHCKPDRWAQDTHNQLKDMASD